MRPGSDENLHYRVVAARGRCRTLVIRQVDIGPGLDEQFDDPLVLP